MMAPVPQTPNSASSTEMPRVRLEVRTGSGRTVGYEIGGSEFLIGAAEGCDLRLPLPTMPPVAAQVTRKPSGVVVRRVSPGLPVHLNGMPLDTNEPQPIRHGDRLDVGGIDIMLVLPSLGVVTPKLVSVEPSEPPSKPQPAPTPDRDLEFAKREAAIAQREAALAERDSSLVQREAALATRDTALSQRESALAQQDATIAQREATQIQHQSSLAQQEHALAQQEQALTQREKVLRQQEHELVEQFKQREHELAEQLEELKADRVLWYRRREEMERELEERSPEFAAREAELAAREKDLAERLAAAQGDQERQRQAVAAERELLETARKRFEAEQTAAAERLQLWEATLATRDGDVADGQQAYRHERLAFEQERRQYAEDLVRFERNQAALLDQKRETEAWQNDLRIRAEQLARDEADLEDRSRALKVEHDRLLALADRTERERAEVETRAAALADRAGVLESQQAVLSAFRLRLDRTREEVEREARQLAQARSREDEVYDQLRKRVLEAEERRAQLDSVQLTTSQERQRLEEREALLSTGLEELRLQREAAAAEDARIRERAHELEVRIADFSEQAGALKGRLTLALDLQARLEADRVALRDREAALAQAEDARQLLQEQLRRRAEELSNRARALDELARTIAAQKAAIDEADADIAKERQAAEELVARSAADAAARSAEVAKKLEAFAEKESSLARQVSRLQDVGRAVAAERKALAEARTAWESDRATFLEADRKAKEEADLFRTQVAAEIEALRRQIPELDEQSKAALDRLNAARGMFRGHLTELHDFAKQSREDLELVRASLREEADKLRNQQQELNHARGEHRLAITAFRQQIIEWQGKVAEIKRTLSQSESRLEAKEAAVNEAARQVDTNSQQLTEQAAQLRREREAVAWKRTSVERHLSDMREWYRKKLSDLANSDNGEMMRPRLASTTTSEDLLPVQPDVDFEDLDPGDLQLGELLLAAELVDASTMTNLWAEAKRQRRTLRQVLLASGAITLYQLALIEAGNIDALMLGRFRVVDRVRATPRENVFRVFDPMHTDSATGGLVILRHLSESEAQDAVHPDEYRQRFAAARDAAHTNLTAVLEVLEIQGRPAVLQEWVTGLPGSEFPAFAAQPGCWVRLLTMAAEALAAAHRAGLVHGRITSDSLLLTADGTLKLTGYADPWWLEGAIPSVEPTPGTDLRALGQVAFGWSQLLVKKRGGKGFPETLANVIRRLEADPAPPMEDTVSANRPYESAGELVMDLKRLAREVPPSEDAWDKLLQHAAENTPEAPATTTRRSA